MGSRRPIRLHHHHHKRSASFLLFPEWDLPLRCEELFRQGIVSLLGLPSSPPTALYSFLLGRPQIDSPFLLSFRARIRGPRFRPRRPRFGLQILVLGSMKA